MLPICPCDSSLVWQHRKYMKCLPSHSMVSTHLLMSRQQDQCPKFDLTHPASSNGGQRPRLPKVHDQPQRLPGSRATPRPDASLPRARHNPRRSLQLALLHPRPLPRAALRPAALLPQDPPPANPHLHRSRDPAAHRRVPRQTTS